MKLGYAFAVFYTSLFYIVSTCVGTVLIYWSFFQDDNILSNLNQTVVVNGSVDNVVEAGKSMILDRSFCINQTKYNGTVTRSFVNHAVYQLPTTNTSVLNNDSGCHDKKYVVEVPSILPSGKYEYRVKIVYELNPIRDVKYNLISVPITVVNPVWDAAKELSLEKK